MFTNLALLSAEPKKGFGSGRLVSCSVKSSRGPSRFTWRQVWNVCKDRHLHDVLRFDTAKKKASEELGDARTVWETLQKELDSCKPGGDHPEVPKMSCILEPNIPDSQHHCCGQALLHPRQLQGLPISPIPLYLGECSWNSAKHTPTSGPFLGRSPV